MNKQENQVSGQQAFLSSLLNSRELQVKLMEDCRNAALNFARALLCYGRSINGIFWTDPIFS
jgi:hypothetical protein